MMTEPTLTLEGYEIMSSYFNRLSSENEWGSDEMFTLIELLGLKIVDA
jgi:hypothetical protein